MEAGFKETVSRQGEIGEVREMGFVDVMPGAGELDKGRKD